MGYVFISYSRKDRGYIEKLKVALDAHGIAYWVDDRIVSGAPWSHVLQEKLNGCSAMIVVMTPASYGSPWVQNELAWAINEKKAIFPLLLDGKLWLSVAATQFEDVSGGSLPPEQYFDEIIARVGAQPPLAEAAEPPAAPETAAAEPPVAESIRRTETPAEPAAAEPVPAPEEPPVPAAGMEPGLAFVEKDAVPAGSGEAEPSQEGAAEDAPPRPAVRPGWWKWAAGAAVLLGIILLFTLPPGAGEAPVATMEPLSTTAVQVPATPVPATATATVTPSPTAAPPAGAAWVRPADGMTMLYVPAGAFTMGIDPQASPVPCELTHTTCAGYEAISQSAAPLHSVTLDGYWIDRTEVTNAMYARCVADGVCAAPRTSRSDTRAHYYDDPFYADFPVVYIAWDMAVTYCQWAGARLPTEAEWEKAARGEDGRLFPWGSGIYSAAMANYDANVYVGISDTTAVGNYPDGASPYGALDMAGNAWEWVADWASDSYGSADPQVNPTGAATGTARVFRGGSFNSGFEIISGLRGWAPPNYAYGDYGFRCASSAAVEQVQVTPQPVFQAGGYAAGAIWTRPEDGMEMVFVPAGDFIFGSQAGDEDERPERTVSLEGFWIDRTEVTNGMYARCVAAGNCDAPRYDSSRTRSTYYSDPAYADFPVVHVYYTDASAYCTWVGGILPTEEEWEKAARGAEGATYPWGEASPGADLVNFAGTLGDTTAVGSYPSGVSPYGALDMAGNVWEFVRGQYSQEAYTSGYWARVLRGGAFDSYVLRITNRESALDSWEANNIGFRCQRTAP